MRVERAVFQKYGVYLKDKTRPPSKGGNTKAWHQHVITINDETFSFLALGSKRWAYAGDLISFDWERNDTKQYRNVVIDTFSAVDKAGVAVVRGNRGSKPWRVADARMPVSRREQRD